MRRPPFCPNASCELHIDPDSPEIHRLARLQWFKRSGTYFTHVRGAVQRFTCRRCRRGFSSQTFSLDYYVKRTIDYTQVRCCLGDSASVRAIARRLECSCDSVTNRCSRLARQCISAHARLLVTFALAEDLAADGFESYAVSQYFPNNIHLLVGSSSQLVRFCDYVTLRRSGRMTPVQKRVRAALEALYRTPPEALTRSFTELLDHLATALARATHRPLTLSTDKKLEYKRALGVHRQLAAEPTRTRLIHQRIDSRAARTRDNPLFAVNYIDRELRKDLAEHVRETVRFARNVNHCMERLWIYLYDHNTRKRFRINDPVGLTRSHAGEAGAATDAIVRTAANLEHRRRFLSFETLEPAPRRVWCREHRTPLKGVVKGVLREIQLRARSGSVDLEEVRQQLKIEPLVENQAQYLPRYTLA